jgi:hypothetical protein
MHDDVYTGYRYGAGTSTELPHRLITISYPSHQSTSGGTGVYLRDWRGLEEVLYTAEFIMKTEHSARYKTRE